MDTAFCADKQRLDQSHAAGCQECLEPTCASYLVHNLACVIRDDPSSAYELCFMVPRNRKQDHVVTKSSEPDCEAASQSADIIVMCQTCIASIASYLG